MSQFAKVFPVNNTQVLFFLTTDDQGKPCVRFITEVDGAGVEIVASFTDEASAALEKATTLFNSLTEAGAIAFHAELTARLAG